MLRVMDALHACSFCCSQMLTMQAALIGVTLMG
jgi:hypothetical protein